MATVYSVHTCSPLTNGRRQGDSLKGAYALHLPISCREKFLRCAAEASRLMRPRPQTRDALRGLHVHLNVQSVCVWGGGGSSCRCAAVT